MSIELSPPSRLMTVLDEFSPTNIQSTASVAPIAAEEASTPITHIDVANTETAYSSQSDPASVLLSEDFGADDLSPFAIDELPNIDPAQAVASQAQQWVQFILSAWS